MKLHITIPIEQYNELKAHSDMLGRIASVVSRYARTPRTTTYECVVKLNERERKLSAKSKLTKMDADPKTLELDKDAPRRCQR